MQLKMVPMGFLAAVLLGCPDRHLEEEPTFDEYVRIEQWAYDLALEDFQTDQEPHCNWRAGEGPQAPEGYLSYDFYACVDAADDEECANIPAEEADRRILDFYFESECEESTTEILDIHRGCYVPPSMQQESEVCCHGARIITDCLYVFQ